MIKKLEITISPYISDWEIPAGFVETTPQGIFKINNEPGKDITRVTFEDASYVKVRFDGGFVEARDMDITGSILSFEIKEYLPQGKNKNIHPSRTTTDKRIIIGTGGCRISKDVRHKNAIRHVTVRAR